MICTSSDSEYAQQINTFDDCQDKVYAFTGMQGSRIWPRKVFEGVQLLNFSMVCWICFADAILV